MTPLVLVLFVAGLVLLVLGAESLVKGASRLAVAVGITPVVVGLTVVAFGTSAPELAVSVGSVWTGRADLALGNVVGSNIFNVLFILGVSALIVPLVVHRQIVRIEVPIMIAVSILVALLAWDGRIGRFDGALLCVVIVTYTTVTVRRARLEVAADAEVTDITGDVPKEWRGLLGSVAYVVLGLALLVIGSNWLVDGAVAIAQALGMSELVIGLTIVAMGTSLPEVATSIMAAIRGHRDIAVGNVIGSNIFNLACVLGVSAVVGAEGVPVNPRALSFDFPVMIAVAFGCLPVFLSGHTITRWDGALFLFYYVLYTVFLVLHAVAYPGLGTLATVTWSIVIPLTLITLAVGGCRSWRGEVRAA